MRKKSWAKEEWNQELAKALLGADLESLKLRRLPPTAGALLIVIPFGAIRFTEASKAVQASPIVQEIERCGQMTDQNQKISIEHLQLEKARLEIEVLRKSLRPDYRNATILIGALTAMLAIAGLTIQWRNAAKDAQIAVKDSQIAELRTQQAIRDAKAASDQLEKTNTRTEQAVQEAKIASHKLAIAKVQLSALRSRLQAIDRDLAERSASLSKTREETEAARTTLGNTRQDLSAKAGEIQRLESSIRDQVTKKNKLAKEIAELEQLNKIYERYKEQKKMVADICGFHGEIPSKVEVGDCGLFKLDLRDMERQYPWLMKGE